MPLKFFKCLIHNKRSTILSVTFSFYKFCAINPLNEETMLSQHLKGRISIVYKKVADTYIRPLMMRLRLPN